MSDRRRYERVPVYLKALCQSDRGYAGYIINISDGGCCVKGDSIPASKKIEKITILTTPPVILSGTIQWLRIEGPDIYYGVKFTEKSRKKVQHLRRLSGNALWTTPCTLPGSNIS